MQDKDRTQKTRLATYSESDIVITDEQYVSDNDRPVVAPIQSAAPIAPPQPQAGSTSHRDAFGMID
jgi:hypothetical protein